MAKTTKRPTKIFTAFRLNRDDLAKIHALVQSRRFRNRTAALETALTLLYGWAITDRNSVSHGDAVRGGAMTPAQFRQALAAAAGTDGIRR